MRRRPNVFGFMSIGALLALAACGNTASVSSVGPQPNALVRNSGAEAAMATEPSPVSPSAPVSPRVATPGIFSPGPNASIE